MIEVKAVYDLIAGRLVGVDAAAQDLIAGGTVMCRSAEKRSVV